VLVFGLGVAMCECPVSHTVNKKKRNVLHIFASGISTYTKTTHILPLTLFFRFIKKYFVGMLSRSKPLINRNSAPQGTRNL
jgi:uncharacterized protein (UPF0262 family)